MAESKSPTASSTGSSSASAWSAPLSAVITRAPGGYRSTPRGCSGRSLRRRPRPCWSRRESYFTRSFLVSGRASLPYRYVPGASRRLQLADPRNLTPVRLFDALPRRWKFAFFDRSVTTMRARPLRTDDGLSCTAPARRDRCRQLGDPRLGWRWWGRRCDGRVGDQERAVHRLPMRLAGVGVQGVVEKRDRERLLPDELEVGAESRRSSRSCSRGGSCGSSSGRRRRSCTSRAGSVRPSSRSGSLSVMSKPSLVPTIAVSVGVSPSADPGRTTSETARSCEQRCGRI